MDTHEVTETPPPSGDRRQMRLAGLHHLTIICRDMERTIAFYRDLLGLAIVRDGRSDDDDDARHVWFGDADGSPGTLVSFLEYPELPEGVVGAGSTHHYAFTVSGPDELGAWRDYLRAHGVQCTDTFDRGHLHSLYLRDPDGHIVEIATEGPGF